MSKKKLSGSSSRRGARGSGGPGSAPAERPKADVSEEKPRIPERIREKDAGFGVIKVAVGILVALIVGAGVVSRLVGRDISSRGDKAAGERCATTAECDKGSICFSYQGGERRCYETCDGTAQKCKPGFTCTSAAEQVGRKSTRVRAVCVGDDKVR